MLIASMALPAAVQIQIVLTFSSFLACSEYHEPREVMNTTVYRQSNHAADRRECISVSASALRCVYAHVVNGILPHACRHNSANALLSSAFGSQRGSQ